jgi:hypothetical protein
MINRARTLLINRRADTVNDVEGEEVIDLNFYPYSEPPHVMHLKNRLLGGRKERRCINLKANELMRCVHSCPLSDHAFIEDDRLSYLPESYSKPFVFGFEYEGSRLRVPAISDSDWSDLVLPSDVWTEYCWAVSRESNNLKGELVKPKNLEREPSFSPEIPENGLIGPLRLPRSNIDVYCETGPDFSNEYITFKTKPQHSMLASAKFIESNMQSELNSLFLQSKTEPMRSYMKLWESDEPITDRIGGLVLALIHRTAYRA